MVMRLGVCIASFVVLLLVFAVTAQAQPDLAPPGGGELSVEPDRIGIGLLYSGAEPRVHATVPAGYQVAVRLMGKRDRVELKKKGKVWGVLWMNVGDVALEHVPAAYLLATSAPLAELASPDELSRWDVGYRALARGTGQNSAAFGELVKLKESEGLYGITEGGVRLAPSAAKTASVTASLPLPARAPAGEYTVDVIGFKQGHGHVLGTATLRLERVGLVRSLRSLAMERGLLYGCAAVLVALIAGVLTGLIFGRKADKPH